MPHGRKDSWPKIGADRDRRQHALMMLMRQLNRTRNYRSATDPKRTSAVDVELARPFPLPIIPARTQLKYRLNAGHNLGRRAPP